ncbi:Uncharacterised protein [Mycobacteroides abscessus subsp. massiliense]|nr:Uncharacterised protein [Mycobacteroides abscessus subsp. massiliense]
MNFSVRFACFDVETLSDDLGTVCNYAADAGIGGSGKPPKLGQLEGGLHHLGIKCGKHGFRRPYLALHSAMTWVNSETSLKLL